MGRTNVVFTPLWKTCNRSIVLGEEEAGRFGGGVCETIVVRSAAESSVADRVLGDTSFPGTDE